MSGYSENVSVDEGVTQDGVRTILHFEGDSLITQRTYDAQPHLEYAEVMRQAQEGKSWGEGRFVAHIPPAEYARFLAIKNNDERQKAIKAWLHVNSKFCTFDKYLKR